MSQNASSGYIFHRTREQPTPDPKSPPLEQIKFYLDRYKIKEALQIFFHEDTLRLLRDEPDFMWDIIPLICQRLRGLCQYRFRVFEGCERMLCRIAVDENCNPKEVLISLLAEISQPAPSYVGPDQQYEQHQPSHEEDDNVFRAMIRPLEGTLLRMNDPTPRGENYRWVLKVLMRHIDNISLPLDDKLDGKTRLALPNDPSTKRFIEVMPLILSFIEDFSEFKMCGSDYDMKLPMPILTKSQIDEVLNGESATGEDSDADEDQGQSLNNGDTNLEDVDLAFVTKPNVTTTIATATFSDIISDKNNDDDDLANFYDDHSPIRGDIFDASVTALISLLKRPLTFLDLSSYCSDLKLCASRCLNILLEQVPNLFAPVYKRIMKSNIFTSCPGALLTSATADDYLLSSDQNIYSRRRDDHNHNTSTIHQTPTSILSLATCSYIFRCERATHNCPSIIDQSFPQILTHETLLFCYTPYIIALLERSEVLAHEKGLQLLESILTQIERDSLDDRFLELFENSSLFKNLIQIMVYSRMYTNRRRAYDLFTSLCDLLTHDCKMRVFKKVLGQTDMRPCVRAACIDQYRKHLTIIQKELVNLHQQLSFVSTLVRPTSSIDLSELNQQTENFKKQQNNIPESSVKRGQQQSRVSECSPVVLLQNLTGQSSNNHGATNLCLNNQSPLKYLNTEDNRQDVDANQQLQQGSDSLKEARIMAINGDIMRKIGMWQARYKVFGGKPLVDFLDQCIQACLPDGQHTDLIDNYELLLATLTIFRYLKLRKTMIKDEIEEKYLTTKRLKKTFFDPVRSAISLIMTELKSHHKELVSNDKRSPVAAPSTASASTTTSMPNTTAKSRNIKKRSKGSNARKSNGGTTPATSSKTDMCEGSDGHDGNDMLAYPVDLSAKIAGGNIMNQVEQFEATVGHVKAELNEVDCINWVMCRIDLIESVLVRTCDLYNC